MLGHFLSNVFCFHGVIGLACLFQSLFCIAYNHGFLHLICGLLSWKGHQFSGEVSHNDYNYYYYHYFEEKSRRVLDDINRLFNLERENFIYQLSVSVKKNRLFLSVFSP